MRTLTTPDDSSPSIDREAIYAELHRRARELMRGQRPDHTLQATALVSEAFLKLHGMSEPPRDRGHYLAVASRAMRQVLVDHARAKGRDKRDPGGRLVALEDVVVAYEERAHDLIALDDAVARLATFDEEMARAVELRFFGGLSVEDTADALGMSKRTLERHWRATRAWLIAEIG